MKQSHLLVAACAALLSVATTVSAEGVQGFIRPFAAYVSPTDDTGDYDEKMSYGLAAGICFGKTQNHEVSLEISRVQWDQYENSFAYSFGSAGFTAYPLVVNTKETFMPVLASYRYYFPLSGSKLRLYVGPSVGFTHYDLDFNATGSGLNRAYGDSKWRFTASGNAGFTYQMSDRVQLDLGYRYLHIDDADVDLGRARVNTDAFKAHVVQLGVGVKF